MCTVSAKPLIVLHCTDILAIPAAMGKEKTEVQGHFKYSAARGSLLSAAHCFSSDML